MIVGGKNRELPKTNRKVALTATEYSFKKTALLVIKQAAPARRKSADEIRGRSLTPFFMLVALKNSAEPIAIMHNDSTLTGR